MRTHTPPANAHRRSQRQKIIYLNSGDWVESLTALEYKWGRWSIYEYDEADYEFVHSKLRVEDSGYLDDEDADGEEASKQEFIIQMMARQR